MKNSVSIEAQWLGDIAIQESGDISSVFEIAKENGLSITEKIKTGSEIRVSIVKNVQIADYFRIRNIHPATDSSDDPSAPGGIGYMAVGINFIVS